MATIPATQSLSVIKRNSVGPPSGVPMRKDRGHGGSAGPAEATFLMEISRGNCFDSGIIQHYFTVVWIVFGLWLCSWLHDVGLLTDGDFRMGNIVDVLGGFLLGFLLMMSLDYMRILDGIGWNSCRNLIGCFAGNPAGHSMRS